MRRTLFAIAALVMMPAGLPAQDLPPAMDAAQIGHGQVLSSMPQAKGKRTARRHRATPAQVSACASRARFRREWGADHPKVLKLDRLCRAAGL